MSERLPAPAELLRARPPGAASIDADANGVVHRLMDLADRGNHVDAAERAAELLRGDAGDLRLIAVYLVGWFVERGAPALPELLTCVDDLLGDGSRPQTPASARTIESAIEWLFRTVGDRLAFHAARRDDAWERWLQALTPAQLEAVATRSDALMRKLTGGAAEALHKTSRWTRTKLAPAVERAQRPAPPAPPEPPPPTPPPPAPEEDVDDEPDEPEHEDDDEEPEDEDEDEELEHAPVRRRPPDFARRPTDDELAGSGSTVVIDSPALAALRDKLRGFEVLLERGQLDRAAVIARDVQAVLADFDPVVYLPSLLARYSRLLAEAFPEIEAQWQGSDGARWQILVQLYRADLAGFIDE